MANSICYDVYNVLTIAINPVVINSIAIDASNSPMILDMTVVPVFPIFDAMVDEK